MTWLRENKPIVLLIIFGITISLFSTSIKTTYQVFFVQMTESFSLTRSEFAISGTLFMAFFGISSPIIGYIADRIGARLTILFGIVLTGLLFILLSLSESFYLFAGVYGVGAAFAYTAASYVSLGVLVDEISSPKTKGLIFALVTNGAALGFIILSPLWLVSEAFFDWREVYFMLGLFFLVPMTVLCFWVFRKVKIGQGIPEQHPQILQLQQTFIERFRVVFSNRDFYVLAIGFLGCGTTMAYVDIHFVAQLKDLNLSSTMIGTSLAILGTMEFVGGLLAGFLCGRYNDSVVLASFYLLRALSVFVLYFYPNETGVLVFAALFGLSFMGTVIGTSVITLNLFGKEIKGFAFGFIWFFHQVGAGLATQVGANLYEINGNYQNVLLLIAFIAMFSGLVSCFLTSNQQKSIAS